MTFYASQFNGHYMLSSQNWQEKYKDLKNILLADGNINPDTNVLYGVSYNSPFAPADQQRHEIWIPITEAGDTSTV